eukprot:6175124-Pleurochrysis_carterae.AAC.3
MCAPKPVKKSHSSTQQILGCAKSVAQCCHSQFAQPSHELAKAKKEAKEFADVRLEIYASMTNSCASMTNPCRSMTNSCTNPLLDHWQATAAYFQKLADSAF